MKIHQSITDERISEACEAHLTSLEDPGFCVECGADADGVEPDARGYECEECGAAAVYGAEELAIMVFA